MNRYAFMAICALMAGGGWWLSHVLDERAQLRDDVELLKADIARQASTIKRSHENASFYNLVTKQLINAEAQSRASEEQRQDEYKKIINKSSLCDDAIPAVVADGLRTRADSLRSRALSTDTGKIVREGAGATAAR